MREGDNRTAPWSYCTGGRPVTVKVCSRCVQGCAVGEWSEWSSCNCTSSPFQTRSRTVISPPRNGGENCPPLHEKSVCACARLDIPFDSQPREYTWRTGRWGECEALDSSSRCGAGLRTRTVDCVSTDGLPAPPGKCLQEEAYRFIHPPSPQTTCELPCPCRLGEWSPFSPCTPDCNVRPVTGKRTRTRSVIQFPSIGLTCDEELEESMRCELNMSHSCPEYMWEPSGWSPCQFSGGASCGNGHMTRYVYCLEGGNRTLVDDSFCRSLLPGNMEPSALRSCQVQCPQPCQVGEWSGWSNCPRACNPPTYQNRTRAIIVPPHGGEACPHTLELRLCPNLTCFRWAAEEFTECLHPTLGCGTGSQAREIHCVDVEGNMLRSVSPCLALPQPIRQVTCHVPCPDDCVLSDWSQWSPCSETCGGRVGNRTRQRHFVAFSSSCPYTSDNLVETEPCSDPWPCEVVDYHIQQLHSGDCVPTDDPMAVEPVGSGGSLPGSEQLPSNGGCTAGHGVRNITYACLRGGVEVSDCPIENFRPFWLENCQLPCSSECALSEWSPFSACSASCGYGTKYRSRRLLQFPTTPSSECEVVENGVGVDPQPCFLGNCDEMAGVNWRVGNWSGCQLYTRIRTEECGLGYENRTVTCVDAGTGNVVSESECHSSGLDRPPSIRRCHQPCMYMCLVTEWSDFGSCSFRGNVTSRREIIPRRGCTDWRRCCHVLSSIQLSETISCPTFNPASYLYVSVTDWGDCIFESRLATCGNGMEHRSSICAASISVTQPVDRSFCTLASKQFPDVDRSCNVRCQRNCAQSEWSGWSSCSATCGGGFRTRTRTVVEEPETGGRPCGPAEETDTCSNEPCPFVEVTPGPFGVCVPQNSTSMCGAGMRMRDMLCFINRQPREFSECVDLGGVATFPLVESCVLECPGECVAGEWGEWCPCPTNCPPSSCMQQRQRAILRRSADGSCSKDDSQLQLCDPTPQLYQYRSTPWGDCILAPPTLQGDDVPTPGHYCGAGVHSRINTCINTTSGSAGENVSAIFCEGAGLVRPLTVESCVVPCPVDCKVSAFSDWSECPSCVFNAVQRRSRVVLIEKQDGGEACPALEQTRPCVPTRCESFSSTSLAYFVGVDFTQDSQCGSALQREPFSCRRNTEFLSPSECHGILSQEGGDRLTEASSYVSLSCPSTPNCTYGDWSDWSDCISLCHAPSAQFSFRTRPLLSSHRSLAGVCAAGQHEQRECPSSITMATPPEGQNGTETATGASLEPTEMVPSACIDFSWQTGLWSANEREVHCQSNSGTRVEVLACPNSTRPVSLNETCSSCPPRGDCRNINGTCVLSCQLSSELVQGMCLPQVEGTCFENSHCLLPNEVCNTVIATCQCDTGFDKLVSQ